MFKILIPFIIFLCIAFIYVYVMIHNADPLTNSTEYEFNNVTINWSDRPKLCANVTTKTKYRVGIVFYGLSRSLKYTLPSIQKHVFDVLQQNHIAFDVFWHSLALSKSLSNPRSGEMGVKIDNHEYIMMNPCVVNITAQDQIMPIEFEKYITSRSITLNKTKAYISANTSVPLEDTNSTTINQFDLWEDQYGSVKNILSAFFTLNQLKNTIDLYSKSKYIKYDAIVVLRPDTAVITDIDLPAHISYMRKTQGRHLWVPDMHIKGVCDRAAYGTPEAMGLYLNRGNAFRDGFDATYQNLLKQYPKQRKHFVNDTFAKCNGEIFLQSYAKLNNITIHNSKSRVMRVRTDGSIPVNDLRFQYMRANQQENDYYVAVDMLRCMKDIVLYKKQITYAKLDAYAC